MGNKPTYNWRKLYNALKDDNFSIEAWVYEDAKNCFKLKGRRAIGEFILEHDVTDLSFETSNEYRKSNEIPKPIVNTYTFKYNGQPGYIAFYFDKNDKLWIKSLKYDEVNSNNEMEIKLKKAGFLK